MDPDPPPPEGGAGRIITTIVAALIGLGVLAWTFLGDNQDTTAPAPTPSVATVATDTPSAEPPSVAPSTAETTATSAPPSPVGDPTDTSAPATTAAPEVPTPVVTEYVTVDVQDAARAEMEQLRQESLSRISLDGRWVAVLSTKKSGTTDESQTAKNGTHVFYEDDILALHEGLADLFSDDADVYLLRSSDFGKQPASGDVFWRTVVDRGFYDEDQATDWCNSHFTGTTKQIENACLPKPLVPATQS